MPKYDLEIMTQFRGKVMPKPKPRMYSIGDTIVITGPAGKSPHIGQRALILDFNYLPSSYRKGYRDYMVSLEILDPPHTGDRIRLQGGYMKPLSETTPKLIRQKLKEHTKRKEENAKKRLTEREGIKAAHTIATPSILSELKALKEKDFTAYEERLRKLAGLKPGKTWSDRAWVTFNELRNMSWE